LRFIQEGIYPIVYSYIDGIEKFSYIPEKCTEGMKVFLNTRKGDKRTNKVGTIEELTAGSASILPVLMNRKNWSLFPKNTRTDIV